MLHIQGWNNSNPFVWVCQKVPDDVEQGLEDYPNELAEGGAEQLGLHQRGNVCV